MASYADSTRTPRTLTKREQRLLLTVTGEHRAVFRDHCLYAMALGTGLREHELIAISGGDVFRGGRPRRRLLLSAFMGTGKASARRRFCSASPCAASCAGPCGRSATTSPWLDRAGLDLRVTFHLFRRRVEAGNGSRSGTATSAVGVNRQPGYAMGV